MRIRLTDDRYEEIKRMVVHLFLHHDVKSIPISTFELAYKMGITVLPYSSFPEETQILMRKMSEEGFFAYNHGKRIIYYNDQDRCYGRINHTIMHEVGHVALGHLETSELAEAEAGFFAKYALAPPVLVNKLPYTYPQYIAEAFDISQEAAFYAANYYQKWLQYGKPWLTDYEITLANQFENAI